MLFSLEQSPMVDLSSSYGLRIIVKWFGQRLDAQKSSVKLNFSWNHRKSTMVNCAWFYGLEGVRWFERPHSCPYKYHLTYQRPRLKIGGQTRSFLKWQVTCNFSCPKWKVFLLKITSSYKLQMEFCPTWKPKILVSPFQKVQELGIPMCGCQDMVQSFSKNA